MATIEKRISMSLTKEDIRILALLEKKLGESTSQVLRRAIMFLNIYYINLEKKT